MWAALAAVADHSEGFLVRRLLEEHSELNSYGCYQVSLFLGTGGRKLEHYRRKHPSVAEAPKEVFSSNTRNSVKSFEKGSWRRVVVDDLVPVNKKARPRACNPKGKALWPCIIEKAFAKACGSYQNADFVDLTEALVILTGQSTVRVDLARLKEKDQNQLWLDLSRYKEMGTLVTAGILDQGQRVLPNGLVTLHAYSFLDLFCFLDVSTGRREQLVKLRNPWGQKCWRGDFGPLDARWATELFERIHEDQGVFCMLWRDFLANFTKIHACHVGDGRDAKEARDGQ
ncbi:unnamed protein product [Effrenium voratum]|nr:unnamed protein product [Effrenium voratum]